MHVLIMPRQGNTVESCIITDWKVNEGEIVTSETAVCEVETDKASFEITAGASGILLKILHQAGDDVPVLEPIAVIGEENENWELGIRNKELGAGHGNLSQTNNDKPNPQSQTPDTSLPTPHSPLPTPHYQLPTPHTPHPTPNIHAISPRAQNLAKKESLPTETIPGTGPGGRIIERDVLAAIEKRPALTAAAKAADGTVPHQGTGIGGRVTAEDMKPSAGQPALTAAQPQIPAYKETAIKGIRKVISDRMHRSLAETAQFTLNASASVSKLQEIRSRMKASQGFSAELGLSKITVNDLILFAVSRVLPRFSSLNAHKINDTIKTFECVNLGMAVDTPRGLMVPVIHNANMLTLAEIASDAKRLAAACQNGSARPEEISGSAFTISNLGSLGITSFTPIINAPEVAILGVCGIELKPVAIENDNKDCGCDCCKVSFEPMIGFSLTINHQAVDGAPAARFLKALCDAVKDIDLLLAAG